MTHGAPAGARLHWGLIAAAVVVLCALPALVLGARVDAWADRVLVSLSADVAVAGLVVGLLTLDTVLPVPSSVLATVAGRTLGLAGGAAAIFVGLCLGNVLGYLIGRLAAAPVVERLVGPEQLAWARARIGTRPGAIALFVTRPVPILSEAAVVLVGAARAPLRRTAAVLATANVGLAVVYAALGAAAHGTFALPLGLAGAVGVPVGAVAAAAMLDAYRRRRVDGGGTMSGGKGGPPWRP